MVTKHKKHKWHCSPVPVLPVPLKQVSGKASHSSAELFNIKDEINKVHTRVAQTKAIGAPADHGGVPCPAQIKQDGV